MYLVYALHNLGSPRMQLQSMTAQTLKLADRPIKGSLYSQFLSQNLLNEASLATGTFILRKCIQGESYGRKHSALLREPVL